MKLQRRPRPPAASRAARAAPTDVAAHLGECAPCCSGTMRLVQLERDVRCCRYRRPVQGGLAEQLATVKMPPPRPRPAPARPSRFQAFLQSPALPPAALAAGLLLFAGFWWLRPVTHGNGPWRRPWS